MHIRALVEEDAAAYLDLRLFALRESPSSFGSSYEEEKDRTLTQARAFLANTGERVTFGAFEGAALVGLCGVGREAGLKERHRGFIRSMYVAPPNRAKGVGGALLARACEHAASLPGLEQLTLAVTAGNESAMALYVRQGFVTYGCAPRALRVGERYFDEVHMVKHLAAA